MGGFDETALADLLATARRDLKRLSGLNPALVPPNADAAYRVAARVEQTLGWPLAGWKVAGTGPEMQRRLRTGEPIRGPVYDRFVHESPATLDSTRLVSPLVEAEIAFVLARDLPPRAEPYGRAEVLDSVAAIRPAIEVAECRFGHRDLPPVPAILADGSGSGHLVLGAAREDFRAIDLTTLAVVLRVDGVERARGTGADVMGDPVAVLAWLSAHLARSGRGLSAGQVVSTGTITGMVVPRPGETHEADFGVLGKVRVAFEG